MFETLDWGELVGITGGKGGASCSDFSSSHSSVSFFVVFEKTREVWWFFFSAAVPLNEQARKILWLCIYCHWLQDGSTPGDPSPNHSQGDNSACHVRGGGFSHLGEIIIQKKKNRKKKQTKHPAVFLPLGENILTIPDERAQPDGAHCTCFSCFSWLWLLG